MVTPETPLTEEVVVTLSSQTTIPVRLRRKYGISEGTRLEVEDMGKGILLRKGKGALELIGSGAGSASVDETEKRLDEIRAKAD